MYIERALESLVRRYSDNFKVVVVTGPRQVGKTTMLKHLSDKDASRGVERTYVTMDDTTLRSVAKEDPRLFFQRYQPPILIDEVQKAPELLPYIKILADESTENGSIWLTGSQPLHLMKHVSESLAGRVGIIRMMGLSNAEIAGIKSEPFMPSSAYFTRRIKEAAPLGVTEAFERIVAGSLPGIRALPADLRPGGYESYIDTYVMRDIRDLAQVSDEMKFRRFMSACAALTGRPVVYAELARIADIDEKTAKAWLSLLESSYLVSIVPPYSNNLLKRLGKRPLMHFTDTGLAAYLAGWSSAQSLELGAMSGQIFETYAYGEIDKSYANSGLRTPAFFFRTNDKREIDIVLEREGTLYPIEVKKSANPTKRDAKNFAALDGTVGTGTIMCMVNDTYPVSENVWAFPVWAV